jgi:hypothetical protein
VTKKVLVGLVIAIGIVGIIAVYLIAQGNKTPNSSVSGQLGSTNQNPSPASEKVASPLTRSCKT